LDPGSWSLGGYRPSETTAFRGAKGDSLGPRFMVSRSLYAERNDGPFAERKGTHLNLGPCCPLDMQFEPSRNHSSGIDLFTASLCRPVRLDFRPLLLGRLSTDLSDGHAVGKVASDSGFCCNPGNRASRKKRKTLHWNVLPRKERSFREANDHHRPEAFDDIPRSPSTSCYEDAA
jgi:hypothetical protein